MVQWVIEGRLARGSRPGYHLGKGQAISEPIVKAWCDEIAEDGVRSILCLLAKEHLDLYAGVPGGLIDYYRARGFDVEHVPVVDHKWPPLDSVELEAVLAAVRKLPEPVLVHCSAGIDRTGAAIKYLVARLETGEFRKR